MSRSNARIANYTKVRFVIEYKLESDSQILGVVGSHKHLGKWDPKKAVLAEQVDDGQWHVTVKLPSKRVAYYKWAILQRETMDVIQWEERGNRSFATTPDCYEMKMHCVFGGGESVESELITNLNKDTPRQPRDMTGFAKEPECFTKPRKNKVVYWEDLPPPYTPSIYNLPVSAFEGIPVTSNTKMELDSSPPSTSGFHQTDDVVVKTIDSQTKGNVEMIPSLQKPPPKETLPITRAYLIGRVGLVAIGVGIGLVTSVLFRRMF